MCLYDMTVEENMSRSMVGANRSRRGRRESDCVGDLYKNVLDQRMKASKSKKKKMKWHTEEAKNNGFQVQWDPGGQKMSLGPHSSLSCFLNYIRFACPSAGHCKLPTVKCCLKPLQLGIPP